VEFRILGALEVVKQGRPLALPQQKARALLAYLILHANEAVSADVLVDAVWGAHPPKTVTASLQNYVSRLRKALGAEALISRPPGYLLRAEPDRIDLRRAERLVEQARQTDGDERADKLRQALALWRGPALADLAYEPFAQTELPRLEELRLTTLEDRIDAELALGQGAELVGELEGLVAEHPLRERFRAQLMLALYRAGRQADALEAYQQARATLVEELGIEPSPALRQLEQAILRQDDSLGVDRAVVPPARRAAAAAPTAWRRKTVTVLFAESTPLPGADPEAVQEANAGFAAELEETVARHGGAVQELAGDSAMAVFGVPAGREDDALRAVRAAAEIRAAHEALRERTQAVELRVGVNTGEVLAGEAEDVRVSGEPVAVSKRLEERAEPGDVLLGPATLALVRDAVVAESVGPLELRGRAEPLPAFRLVGVLEGAAGIARALDTPLVGRERELADLRRAFERARDGRRCAFVALVGEPGIGKTRLARELAASVGDEATVLAARCPSYGAGATYLPVAELVAQAAGDASEEAIASLLEQDEEGEVVARRIAELIGLAEGAASGGEAFWAVRRFVEALARERPLVLVLEDLHWAEPTFLDLVEYLSEWIADAPVLLVATGRPELLEARATWASAALPLEPLGELDAHALIDNFGAAEVPPAVRASIVETAEGNPLFVEQLLAFAAEEDAQGGLPPTLEALLASRLDRLERGERGVLERASVAGREFWRGAVLALSPAEEAAAAGRHLMTLVRKGFVRAARSALPREDGFRFHHALIRDVAYAAIPKARRAELHERLGDWLDERGAGMGELVGSHLEEAFRLRTELGPADRAARRLAADAGVHLGRAGIRAFKHGDIPATVNLLERATALLPEEDAYRRELICELGLALRVAGELARAESVLAEAAEASRAAGDRRLELRAELELANVRLFSEPAEKAPEVERRATEAIPLFEALGDDRSLGRASLALASVRGDFYCVNSESEDAAERAAIHYERAGWTPAASLGQVATAMFYGPRPVDDAIRRCNALLLRASGSPAAEASILVWIAGLEAMRGRFDTAGQLEHLARRTWEELGQGVVAANACAVVAATIEVLAGNYARASHFLRASCEFCLEMHESAILSTRAAELADALYALERYDEAGEWARLAQKHGAREDRSAQFSWRSALAKVSARKGALEEAESLARSALDVVGQTDALNHHAKVLLDLAEVLRLAHRPDEAAGAVEDALTLYERKGNIVAARATRALLDELVPA
jgi:DNA-binding SARP family transcriptional activator